MFIAPMPEELPTGYRKDLLEWLSQSVWLANLLRNWGADSNAGLSQASGIPLDKILGFTPQQQKVVAAIWLEDLLWNDLGQPSSLGNYRRAITTKYGV